MWAHKDPYDTILLHKSLILMKDHKIANSNIKGLNLKKKIKMLLCDKDLSSVNLVSETYDFTKKISLLSKTYDFVKRHKFA